MEIERREGHDAVFLSIVCSKEEADFICNNNAAVSSDKDPIVNLIECEIIRKYGYTFEVLETKSRKIDFRVPRQIAMYLLKTYTRLTLDEIGYLFKKDHATVVHACKVVENFIDTEKLFRSQIQEIINKIDEAI